MIAVGKEPDVWPNLACWETSEMWHQNNWQAKATYHLGNASSVLSAAILLRIGLLVYGYWQDHHSALKYTDIDYFVFTDAARFIVEGRTPYLRDTYRYTPLLAWLLVPTSWSKSLFGFGKCLFAAGDISTGVLTIRILERHHDMDRRRAVRWSTIWLLNPMVATISTRGSSEGLLAAMVVALLYAALEKKIALAGMLLGLAVHFKIYPFIYAISVIWWIDSALPILRTRPRSVEEIKSAVKTITTLDSLTFAASSAVIFVTLNLIMFLKYGQPFIEHTFLYHLVRTDHRHNFSPYSTMLYQQSAEQARGHPFPSLRPESLAFIPQLALSAVTIPLALARKDLASAMLAQTFAFVSFNKVCTSQYFLWYIVLLPFYLPKSSFLEKPLVGIVALASWILGQGLWLGQGYQLEFLGQSSFVPGLWASSLAFFVINIWLLGYVIRDARAVPSQSHRKVKAM